MEKFFRQSALFLLTIGLIFVILIAIGIMLFTGLEGWSTVDAFYFTVSTMTTVGFGDLVPTHDLSKIVTAIYSLVTIPLVLYMYTYVARQYFELRLTTLEEGLKKQLLQEEEDIEQIVTDKRKK